MRGMRTAVIAAIPAVGAIIAYQPAEPTVGSQAEDILHMLPRRDCRDTRCLPS